MIQQSDCIALGNLVKVHGIHGELVLRLKNILPEEIKKMEWVFLNIEEGLVPFLVETYHFIDDQNCLIAFEDYNTIEKAEKLKDFEVFVQSVKIKKVKKILGWEVFIGYRAFNNTHEIGIIDEIIEASSNILFSINQGNILIPANEDFILSVDKKNQKVNFDLPEGLIDL
jgi:16S rRNA processing protein RimM